MYQIRNKLHKINVVKSPKNDVNACEDFIEIVTAGHIVASSYAVLRLKSKDDIPSDDILPNAKDVWFKSHEERKKCLMQLCELIYDKFVCFSYNGLNCDLKASSERDGVFSYSTAWVFLPRVFRRYQRRRWRTCPALLEISYASIFRFRIKELLLRVGEFTFSTHVHIVTKAFSTANMESVCQHEW